MKEGLGIQMEFLWCTTRECCTSQLWYFVKTIGPVIATCSVQSWIQINSCVWWCRKKHDQPDPKPNRYGCTTKFRCPVCKVSLCRVKHLMGWAATNYFAQAQQWKTIAEPKWMLWCTLSLIETVHRLQIEVGRGAASESSISSRPCGNSTSSEIVKKPKKGSK
jgi:hypothetical protein